MPARKRLRLVVDVNVLVSGLVSHDRVFLRSLFNKQRFTVVVSAALMAELEDVLHRPRMRKYLTMVQAEGAIDRIHFLSEDVIKEPPVKPVCRDPKDDYLLALAKTAKADLLITGDADLLVLEKYGKTKIIKPALFKREYL